MLGDLEKETCLIQSRAYALRAFRGLYIRRVDLHLTLLTVIKNK